MTVQVRLFGALPVGVALLLFGCGKSPASQGSGAASSAASVSASALSASVGSAAASAAPKPPPRDPTCRALRVEGEATVGALKLESGAEVDGSEWVTLAKGANLTLKHAASGREISLAGPALFRACRRGREQVLLAQGKVTVGSGMGARPGAEVLIATPVAGVRYGEADFTLVLDEKKLSLEVRTGQVEVDPVSPPAAAAGAPPKPAKGPLHAKDKLSIPLGTPDPVELMARCKAAAEAAESSARRVGDKNAPEPLGERAQAHVRARRAARAACTIAAASTGLVADPSASAGLWAEAARWEGLWETIPRPGGTQAPEK